MICKMIGNNCEDPQSLYLFVIPSILDSKDLIDHLAREARQRDTYHTFSAQVFFNKEKNN